MSFAQQLRGRFLTALSGSLVMGTFLPLACSAHTESTSKEKVEPSCSSGKPQVECFAPGSTHFSQGQVPDPMPAPPATFDANNCQVRAEVRDGCCNAAVAGPNLVGGQCCYGFCTGACCGRPLLVAGEARIAPATERADWLGHYDVNLSGLSAKERSALSDAWLRDARFEHASIASFARFILDLLAFGAPPELLERAQRAMGDEIAHARACFALASAYAGRALGPGRLELRGVEPSASLAAAAAAAVREGCVNETIAALTAQEHAQRTRDPVVRSVLERIARDEADHAELAWRFVEWALHTGDAAVSYAVQSAFRAPSSTELDSVAAQAWTEVITPVAARLS
jgi:hypothetical protein